MAEPVSTLAVKITADSKDFDKALSGVSQRMEQVGQQMQKVGKALTIGVTVPLVALGAAAIKAANTQAQAEEKLRNAIRATGRAADMSFDNLKAYASQLQRVTLFGDEVTLSAMGIIQSMSDIGEKGLKQVIPLLQDFATAMGVDLETAAQMAGKTLDGSINGFSRYGIQVDLTGTKTERLAQLTEQLSSRFGGAAESMARVGTGPIKQAQNALGDAAEVIGDILLPHVVKLADSLKGLAESFQALPKSTQENIVKFAAFAAVLGPVTMAIGKIMVIAPKVVAAIKTIGVVVSGISAPFAAGAAAIGALVLALSKLHEANNLRISQTERLAIILRDGHTKDYAEDIRVLNMEINSANDALRDYNQMEGLTDRQRREAIATVQADLRVLQERKAAIERLIQANFRNMEAEAAAAKPTQLAIELQKEMAEAMAAVEAEMAAIEERQKQAANRQEELRQEKIKYGRTLENIAALEIAGALSAIEGREALIATYNQEISRLIQLGKTGEMSAEDVASGIAKIKSEMASLGKEVEKSFGQKIQDQLKEIVPVVDDVMGHIRNIAGAVGNLIRVDTELKIRSINDAEKAALKAAGIVEKTEKQKIQETHDTRVKALRDEYDAAIEQGDALKAADIQAKLDEEQRDHELALKKLEIQETYERQRLDASYKASLAQWGINLTMAYADAAQALIKTFATLGFTPEGFIAAGLGAAASGLQIAAMHKSKPQPPAYARGTQFHTGGQAMVGEEGPELVNLPRGAEVVPFTRRMSGSAGGGVVVNIYSPEAVSARQADMLFSNTARQLAFEGVI